MKPKCKSTKDKLTQKKAKRALLQYFLKKPLLFFCITVN